MDLKLYFKLLLATDQDVTKIEMVTSATLMPTISKFYTNLA
jgi:hypothetical protein